MPDPLLIHALTLRPVAGVNDVRIHLPCRALAKQPGVRVVVQETAADLSQRGSEAQAVFLWQRPIIRYAQIEGMRRLIALGYVMVVEFDDHPMVWPDIAANDNLNFRGVHAVQTSTDALAGLLRQYNGNIAVFPNAIESLPPLRARRGETLTLFFGALRREQDWAPVMPALNEVLRECGERVRVVVVYDRAFHDALATPHKTFYPMLRYDAYLSLLSIADINLLPLLDDEFRRMKSDLKFIESAAHGAVVLASPTVYAKTVRDGETGLIYRTPEEFGALLRGLVANRERLDTLARAAWDYVKRERLLARQAEARLAWYRELCAQRAALSEQLYQRVPQLRA